MLQLHEAQQKWQVESIMVFWWPKEGLSVISTTHWIKLSFNPKKGC